MKIRGEPASGILVEIVSKIFPRLLSWRRCFCRDSVVFRTRRLWITGHDDKNGQRAYAESQLLHDILQGLKAPTRNSTKYGIRWIYFLSSAITIISILQRIHRRRPWCQVNGLWDWIRCSRRASHKHKLLA